MSIIDSVFEKNSAEQGGALRALINTDLFMRNVSFIRNTAKNYGGVLKLD